MTATTTERRALFPGWPAVGLTVVVIALILVGSAHVEAEPGTRSMDALAVACGLVGALSLLLWRASPIAMVVLAAGSGFAYTALDYPGGPALLPGPVALLLLGYAAPRRVAWAGAGLEIVAVTAGRRIGGQSIGLGELLVLGWALAAVLAGQAARAASDRRAADRVRQEELRHQAVVDERLRIAQDLHDSVAHAMATINVQAGVAAHLLDRRPEQARDALEAIRSASSDVLDELGTIVGVLRDPGERAPLAPTGGMDDVASLVERARLDGLQVTCSIRGLDGTVPVPVGGAAFRVVQEALTNVRRHAGAGATAEVTVTGGPDDLLVLVVDDGGAPPNGAAAPSTGLGLVGMRERVAATGGTLRAGPRPEGGFEVRAEWELTA